MLLSCPVNNVVVADPKSMVNTSDSESYLFIIAQDTNPVYTHIYIYVYNYIYMYTFTDIPYI